MRRSYLLVVMVVGVLASASLASTLGRGPNAAAQVALDRPALAAPTTPAPEPTTAAAVVPTTVLAPPTTQGPIGVPDDPYAPEDVVRLGRIIIPKLGLDADMYHGVTLRNIDKGPSHWPGSALPGQVGNVVVAGHRVTHTHPFLHIDSLVAGDQIVFVVDGVRSVYEVTGTEVVYPSQMSIVRPTADPQVTLFACHPPHSARQRYVVHGRLVASGPA